MGAGRAGCRGDLDPWSRPPTLPPPPAGGGSTFFPAVLQATEQTGLSPEGGSSLHTAAAGGSELPVAGGVQGKRCGGDSALMAVVSLPRTQLAGDEAGGTRRGEVTSVLAQGAGPRSPEHSWPLCSHIWLGSIWPGAEGPCFLGGLFLGGHRKGPARGSCTSGRACPVLFPVHVAVVCASRSEGGRLRSSGQQAGRGGWTQLWGSSVCTGLDKRRGHLRLTDRLLYARRHGQILELESPPPDALT